MTAEEVDASKAGIWAFLAGQPEVLTLSDTSVMWLLDYGKTMHCLTDATAPAGERARWGLRAPTRRGPL